MENQIVAAIVGAIGGLASGAIAALVTLRSKGLDRLLEERKLLVTAYDSKLLDHRLIEYKKLWKLTESTSRQYIDQFNSAKASALANDLTSWYYADGGMLLSGDARDAFFAARHTLKMGSDAHWHKSVVDAFSALRTAVSEDINSRRGPTVRSPEPAD